MNCPNNTYYSCNSCCSGVECTCKKTTTTTSTTTINVPCDVNNCEEIIDLQCVIHYNESECIGTNNSDLQSLIGTIFEKVTGYNCSCDFCGAIVEKVLIPSTTTTTTSNITTTTTTSNVTTTTSSTTTTTTISPCYCYTLKASDQIDGGYYSYVNCEGVQLNNQYIDQNEELFICAKLNTVFASTFEITIQTQQKLCANNNNCQPTTTSTTTSTSTTSTSTSTSTSTTTTTTLNPNICNCYTIINETQSPSTYGYQVCNGNILSDQVINGGITIKVCAVQGSVVTGIGVSSTGPGPSCIGDMDCNQIG